ncbi:hypothetical protein J2X69_002785 [Algoriphagus sp. 4150]|uniref:hypothetical protein n=1 Tax=Algoriphagus sp. 4150 TaxID=2817756 RepID=UPI0028663722|nr:hypothetical protein [Algoriphagus sp. 4150]MDR7130435.1 hypothetical protein [Algoriphagus sp. 4150]
MIRSVIGLVFLIPFVAFGQQTERKLQISPDVHFRMYWMSTSYWDTYKDDYALGTSLNLGTKLNYIKHWELRVGYRVFANLLSSDLTALDPVSGGRNRYELGLFDLLNQGDRIFGKLENFSLTYSKGNWGIAAGRMPINEDWVNAHDGRLSPTGIEGVKAWFTADNQLRFSAWGIGRMSVRGTSEWLSVGESIGVYPVGRNLIGNASLYAGNTLSDWIGIAEVARDGESMNLSLSTTMVQNISNTLWAKAEKRWQKEQSEIVWFWGIQAGFQSGLGNGGNEDSLYRYKDAEDRNWAVSTRFRYNRSAWDLHLAYTKTGGNGIWLSPREWGKDAWYTFVPRERNEGNSALDAFTAFAEYTFPNTTLRAFAHLGFHWLPPLDAPWKNKYNMPSYRQINMGMKYSPKSKPKLDFQLLAMNKEAFRGQNLKPNQKYNKVGLIHVNGIVNWRWD